jgi:hypothetical protein
MYIRTSPAATGISSLSPERSVPSVHLMCYQAKIFGRVTSNDDPAQQRVTNCPITLSTQRPLRKTLKRTDSYVFLLPMFSRADFKSVTGSSVELPEVCPYLIACYYVLSFPANREVYWFPIIHKPQSREKKNEKKRSRASSLTSNHPRQSQ